MIYTQNRWLEIFSDWEQSGLTRAEFCRTHKLATSTFDYWRQKIRKNSTVRSELVKVSLETVYSQESALKLVLPGGFQLEVPIGYRSEHLKRLLADIQEIQ